MRGKMKRNFEANSASFWIPVECSLLTRYNFVALMPHSRYIYVAILLHCGVTGSEEIPTDTRFLANIFGVDERTISKSLDELENANLLVERKKEEIRKEHTDRQETADAGAVCVEFENLSQEFSEQEKPKTENENGLLKIVSPTIAELKNNSSIFLINSNNSNIENAKNNASIFSIEECLKYVEICKSNGEVIQSPKALANHLRKTGEADAFITATLYPAKQADVDRAQFGEPIIFLEEPCAVCFGAKMSDVDGKGYRACEHCKKPSSVL